MIALSQFTELKRLAAGILASTAVLGLIVGFAAQHTIGNMVAGVQIARLPAVPDRRPDQLRRERGPGHRHHPLLHLRRPRRRQLGRDPQPAAGRRRSSTTTRPKTRRPERRRRARSTLCVDDAAHPATPATPRRDRRQAPARRRRRLRADRDRRRSRVTSWVLDVAADAPSLATCKPIDKGGNSAIYAADGSKLGVIASDEARTPVSIERIPKSLQLATVAIEDQRFYEHGGVDPEGILRAAVKDLEAGKAVEGGSTITQQLVRNLCIRNPERNLERKIVEAKLAIEYSERHTRREILGSYLNIASYGTIEGSTAVGVRRRLADLLLPAGLEARPAAGGAARRACRRRPPNTTRSSTRGRRASAATRCCGRWPSSATSAASAPQAASERASGSTSPTTTSSTASPTSSTTSRTS